MYLVALAIHIPIFRIIQPKSIHRIFWLLGYWSAGCDLCWSGKILLLIVSCLNLCGDWRVIDLNRPGHCPGRGQRGPRIPSIVLSAIQKAENSHMLLHPFQIFGSLHLRTLPVPARLCIAAPQSLRILKVCASLRLGVQDVLGFAITPPKQREMRVTASHCLEFQAVGVVLPFQNLKGLPRTSQVC